MYIHGFVMNAQGNTTGTEVNRNNEIMHFIEAKNTGKIIDSHMNSVHEVNSIFLTEWNLTNNKITTGGKVHQPKIIGSAVSSKEGIEIHNTKDW